MMTLVDYTLKKSNIYISYFNKLTTYSNPLIEDNKLLSSHSISLKITLNVLHDNLYHAFNSLFNFKNILNKYELYKNINTYIKSFSEMEEFLLAGSKYEILKEEKELINYTMQLLNYYKIDNIISILLEIKLKTEDNNIIDYINLMRNILIEENYNKVMVI